MTSTTAAAPRLYLNDHSIPTFDEGRLEPSSTPSASQPPSTATSPGRQSRFAEDIQDTPMDTTSTSIASPNGAPPLSSSIDPASIPTRTSSSKAVANSRGPANAIPQQRQHSYTHTPPLAVHPAVRGLPGEEQQNSRPAPQDQTSSNPSLPPTEPTKPIGNDLIYAHTPTWSDSKEKILFGPYDYLYGHPGKDIRQQMISAFNQWLQVPTDSLTIITKVIGMLHTSSLLIDDVEDSSHLRRGVPVAHAIFGTAQTINSANYIYFCALQELQKLENKAKCIEIYTEELLNLHRGQGMDLFWRDTLTCPSEDDYLEMVNNKTGGLFRLAIKLMCAESPSYQQDLQNQPNHQPPSSSSASEPAYIPLVNTIGLLFQIHDDYLNLSLPPSAPYSQTKGTHAEDLTEGKFSFPIIHSIRSDPSNLVLINILKQRTEDEAVKRLAVEYVEGTGSFGYTRRVLRGLGRRAAGLVGVVDAGRGRGEGVLRVLDKLRVGRGEGGGKEGDGGV
ncbi:hypothetical protein MBLNU230_g6633t1 [Neophaeotheca triangularis]